MVGRTVSHYEIIEKLGEGGMGAVYRAHDVRLDRDVALKFLPAQAALDPEARRRFLTEARAAAGLQHPNICPVFEIDEAEGELFIAMAYIEGRNLAEEVSAGPLPLPRALDLGVQIARGLAEAHRKGVLHRDIKPANVMVTAADQALIMDFGLAHLPRGARSGPSGVTAGTTAYMAPERLAGEEFDHRSDLWSAGVVLYRMLTGRLPFSGQYEQEIVYSILNEDPAPPEAPGYEIPRDVRETVFRALAKQPQERYQSATELLTALDRSRRQIESGPQAEEPPTRDERPVTESSRARLISQPSVAVLPLVNLDDKEEHQYFSEGITEDIIRALTKVAGLRVAARNSAFQFRGTPDVQQVGRRLRVDAVLTGSLRWAGDRLRLNVQLSSVREGFEMWAEKYDRVLEDVFAVQDEISQAIADKLKVRLVGEQSRGLASRGTENLEAYHLYLKGRYHAYQLSQEGFRKGIEYFAEAIRSDSGYPQPYAGTAVCYAYLALHGYVPPKEVMPQAREFAQRALEIEEAIPEAHFALGMVRHWFEWNWDAAETEYLRAMELNPGDVDARSMCAVLFAALGRSGEAVAHAKRALLLDPISLDVNRLLGYVYYLTGRFSLAIEQAQRTRDMAAGYFPANWSIGMASVELGRLEDALEAWQRAVELAGEDPISEAGLGWTLGLRGRRDEALRIAESFQERRRRQYFANYFIAWVYLGLKDAGCVMKWLEKSYAEREGLLVQLAAEALWRPMDSDARFQDLLRRVGLAS